MSVYIYVCLCEWARDVHRKHDGATVPKFSDWLRRRIVSFADFTASTSFTDWNSEFFADSSLESTSLTAALLGGCIVRNEGRKTELVEIIATLCVTYAIFHNLSIINSALRCLYSVAERSDSTSPRYTGIESPMFYRDISHQNLSLIIHNYS